MTDDDFDPEEHVGNVADRIAVRHALTIAGRLLLVTLAFIAVEVGARFFAGRAVWEVSPWAIGFVVSVLVADVVWRVRRIVTGFRTRRREKAETMHLTEGQKANRQLDELRAERVAYQQHRSWRSRVRRPKWWINLAVDLVYLASFGVVVTSWYTPLVGWIAAAAAFALAVVVRWLAGRFIPIAMAMVGFFDPTAPKDTPEI